MKRSEMIEIIKAVWVDSTSWPSDRRVAEVILDKIEQAGMKPPTIEIEIPIDFDGGTQVISVNVWEEEDSDEDDEESDPNNNRSGAW